MGMTEDGGGVGHQLDGHKRNFIAFRSPYRIPTPHIPFPSTGVRIAKYFAFRTFLRAIFDPDVCGRGGGGAFQTNDVGQGGSKKSVFGQAFLMDDPY